MASSPDIIDLNLDPGAGWGRRFMKWGAGAAMSALILGTLAYVQHMEVTEPPRALPDLQSIILEEPPPPPPEIATREPPPPTVLDLEPLPTDNEIKIAVAALTYEIPLPEAEPILEISLDQFKPEALKREGNPDHIFQYRDVDQHPTPTSRIRPNVTARDMPDRKDKRVVVSMVVTRAGATRNITMVESSGLPDLDAKIIDALAQWQFRPALRNGVPVNCHVIQSVRVKPSGSNSPFSL